MLKKIKSYFESKPTSKPLQNEVRITPSGVGVVKYNKQLVKQTMENLVKKSNK